MTLALDYNETLTFYKVTTGGYRGTKIVEDSADVPCVFVQGTGMINSAFQENVEADALAYPDFENDFIVENANRLEGMYVLANVYGGEDNASWFKIESVAVNRDHLLGNQIDNIECRLKKSAKLPFVS